MKLLVDLEARRNSRRQSSLMASQVCGIPGCGLSPSLPPDLDRSCTSPCHTVRPVLSCGGTPSASTDEAVNALLLQGDKGTQLESPEPTASAELNSARGLIHRC